MLDTHVLLHWAGNSPYLSAAQRQIIEGATAEAPLYLSDITLWEIVTLFSLRRIELAVSLRDFLKGATAPPLVERVRVSPAIAAEVAALPDSTATPPPA